MSIFSDREEAVVTAASRVIARQLIGHLNQHTASQPEGTMKQVNVQQIEKDAKSQWDRDTKLRAEFGDNFTAYLAYRKAEAGGRFKILGPRDKVASHV